MWAAERATSQYWLPRVVGPTGSVVGIDRSPEAVDLALGRVAAAGASTVDIVQADLLDFADTC
jgi:ubiquinone/menaquinone biosynthesis C-methylase UbiE